MNAWLPTIDILIPTLNAAGALPRCLSSIQQQDYPADRVRIIVADGGSTDATKAIARRYGATVVPHTERLAEVGKAMALRAATAELVALIDSDNVLPHRAWLRHMVSPFADRDIVASEPIRFTYRPEDGFITRYCALLGMNDPLCLFLGTYDRECLLTGRWTGLPVREEPRLGYRVVTLVPGRLPTIGANGTLFRREALLDALGDAPELFDIDMLPRLLTHRRSVRVAKVEDGIIHVYADSIRIFSNKQYRRVRDYLYYRSRGSRVYPWTKTALPGVMVFAFACVTVVPLFIQSWRGYRRVRDRAWWFHPLACLLTFAIYATGFLESLIRPSLASRTAWKQTTALPSR